MPVRVGNRKLLLFWLGVLTLCAPAAMASGFWLPRAVTSFSLYPGQDLQGFARGELGILRPDFARSYLIVAYRYLSGSPLSPAEQKSIMECWSHRLGLSSTTQFSSKPYDPAEAMQRWCDARNKIPGADEIAEINYMSAGADTVSFINCGPESFANAERVLSDRVKRFGADSAEVKEWLKAQDTVFRNCNVDPGHYRHWEDSPRGPFLPGTADRKDEQLEAIMASKGSTAIAVQVSPSTAGSIIKIKMEKNP